MREKTFKCGICDYNCSIEGNMNSCNVTVHEGKKPFKCDICDYWFLPKGDMNRNVAKFMKKGAF